MPKLAREQAEPRNRERTSLRRESAGSVHLKFGSNGARFSCVTRRQRAVGSRAARRSGPCHLQGIHVRARTYVDGFNLYCGAVKGTPCKWSPPANLLQRAEDAT